MSKPVQKKAKTRVLSADEQALWQKVKKTVSPLDTKAEAPPMAAKPKPVQKTGKSEPAKPARPVRITGADFFHARQPQMPPSPQAGAGNTSQLDSHTQRQLIKGKRRIDARIDLHGLTEDEAFSALYGFIINARQRGYRLVLVITGKGTSKTSKNQMSTDRQSQGVLKGVLKRQLPNWLRYSDLRNYVSGFNIAARHHGGEGAFYVQLRKNPKIIDRP